MYTVYEMRRASAGVRNQQKVGTKLSGALTDWHS